MQEVLMNSWTIEKIKMEYEGNLNYLELDNIDGTTCPIL